MKKSFKPGTLLSPVPAVMVSCGEGDSKNIITIGWTGIINSEPPITYISVRKSRHSHHIIEETGEFVINLTTEKLARATDYCGVKSGRDIDKFKELKLTPEPGEKVKCPMIAESPVNLECRVIEVKSYPTHDMFIAEIVAVHADDEIIDEKGRIDISSAGLLAYVHGEYFGLRKASIGRFGFSVMKPKTRKRINRQKHEERVSRNREKRKGR
ncbi:MAG: flavin reductase family protein [Anaerovoracaceae bacterium]